MKGRGHLEDSLELDERTRDGDLDMVLQFGTQASGLGSGDTEACVVGTLTSGGATYAFMGCDVVTIGILAFKACSARLAATTAAVFV